MVLVSICLVVLCLLGAVLFLRKPARGPGSSPAPAAGATRDATTPPRPRPAAPRPPADASPAKPSEALARLDALTWIRAESLPESRREAITTVFRNVPRPPRLLHQLISPEFVNNTGLEELAELVGSEPLVAARVLATANSPMFGLATPVTGLPQAISTLGLITLRILCLQYMMIRSFKADSPERQTLLGNLWNASALGSELCLKLARKLGRPEPGRLVTLVVLSFLGRLATTATVPRGLLADMDAPSFLDRTSFEQTSLGLNSAEIGGLLMREWNLPPALVEEVRRVDPCLVEPPDDVDLAICYVSARLGKRLASGELADLADFDLFETDNIDFHRLQQRLLRPGWPDLAGALHDPALLESIRRMTASLRDGSTTLA